MRYRPLGDTELTVSVVGIGAWQFGGEWGKEFTQREVDRILRRAGDLGVTLVDTAECYGDHRSEELIGAAIQRDRDRWVIATKFGHRFHGRFDRTDHWSPGEVLAQLEASLRALRTDHVDLYQFHSGADDAFDREDLWEALADEVRKGKVRHLGVSVGSNRNLHQVERARELGAGVVQIVYNRLDRVPEEGAFPLCEEHRLGVLARVPLASGYLSGKYRPGQSVTDPGDYRSRQDRAEAERRLEEVDRIRRTEVPEGVAMATWALAWCLRHPAVTAVIPGCKSVEQVEANAAAADLDIVPGDHPRAPAA